MTGSVYLIGAGPGAVDLLTLRAERLLREADVVLYDALVTDEIIAIAKRARKLAVGKRAGRASPDQAFISRMLVRSAQRHAIVVRLKGGDPCLFARADEELSACRAANIPVEIVPGVTAGFAAAAMLLTPLTKRDEARSVAFVTPATASGARASDSWADAATHADTVVVYMGKREAARVREILIAKGRLPATPIVFVESVSRPEGTIHGGVLNDLEVIAAETGDGPVLLLLGAVFASAATEYCRILPAQERRG